MKYALAAILVLLVAAGAYFFFRMQTSSTSPTACADAHLNVAAFGDSLVEGYGATAGHDFPSLLSTTLGVPVQNFGRSGDTTSDALARIDSVVSAQPDVVIVLLGGNYAAESRDYNPSSTICAHTRCTCGSDGRCRFRSV
jgi:acyl-CoA thioesterase-1